MKTVTYSIESADFMLNKHTFRGEPVTAIQELNGKLYLFTANHTYVVRKTRWYERLWKWFFGASPTGSPANDAQYLQWESARKKE